MRCKTTAHPTTSSLFPLEHTQLQKLSSVNPVLPVLLSVRQVVLLSLPHMLLGSCNNILHKYVPYFPFYLFNPMKPSHT